MIWSAAIYRRFGISWTTAEIHAANGALDAAGFPHVEGCAAPPGKS
jgi:hypothetical protein